jgi:hypothetical protein
VCVCVCVCTWLLGRTRTDAIHVCVCVCMNHTSLHRICMHTSRITIWTQSCTKHNSVPHHEHNSTGRKKPYNTGSTAALIEQRTERERERERERCYRITELRTDAIPNSEYRDQKKITAEIKKKLPCIYPTLEYREHKKFTVYIICPLSTAFAVYIIMCPLCTVCFFFSSICMHILRITIQNNTEMYVIHNFS